MTIIGSRVRAALAAVGLSVNAAAKSIREGGRATISQSALALIVDGSVATTRTSIRDELARLCGLDADEAERAWLSGVGPDRTAVELVARRLANRSWDVRRLRELARHVRGVRTSEELAQRIDELKEGSYRTALTILDIERWRELLGDPLATAADEEERVGFAVSLGRALNLARKGASPMRTRAEHELRRTSAGLKALERLLREAGQGEDEKRP